MNDSKVVSVIIPSYNRSVQLMNTLKSFVSQSIAANSYEIIVSDNNSSDDTGSKVKDFIANISSVDMTYIFEPRQGVHYARNSAAKVARGEILYFTDDDMIASPELLEKLVDIFRLNEKIGCATGPVIPNWEFTPPNWILKYCQNFLLSLINRSEILLIAPYDIGCFSCHQAIRKDVFFQTGGFHPENTAGTWLGDGETGLNQTVKNLGYYFAYTSESVIYHCIPKSRMTQSYLNKRLHNQGFCDSYTEYRLPAGTSRLKLVLSIGKSFVLCFRHLCFFALKYVSANDSWHLDLGYFWYHSGKIIYKARLLSFDKWRQLVQKSNWLDV